MSPEQARGDAIDHRSDLFSLGSVLYTACTGRVPFRAESAYGILRRITDNEPRPIREINPQIPDWLCRVIEKLHSKSSDNRYATAEEVSDLLQRCLVHEHSPSTPLPAELQTASIWRRPGRKFAAVLGMTTAAILIAVASHVGTAEPASPEIEFAHSEPGPLSLAGEKTISSATDGTATQEDSSVGDISSGSLINIPNAEVGAPGIDTNETAWSDPQEISPFYIQRTARRLAEETESDFANAPAAKGILEEGIDQ